MKIQPATFKLVTNILSYYYILAFSLWSHICTRKRTHTKIKHCYINTLILGFLKFYLFKPPVERQDTCGLPQLIYAHYKVALPPNLCMHRFLKDFSNEIYSSLSLWIVALTGSLCSCLATQLVAKHTVISLAHRTRWFLYSLERKLITDDWVADSGGIARGQLLCIVHQGDIKQDEAANIMPEWAKRGLSAFTYEMKRRFKHFFWFAVTETCSIFFFLFQYLLFSNLI